MSSTMRKIIDRLSGRGWLYHRGTLVADVYYDLDCCQELLFAHTAFGTDRLAGPRTVQGVLLPVRDHQGPFPEGDGLVLRLADGRGLRVTLEQTVVGGCVVRRHVRAHGGFMPAVDREREVLTG